MECGHALIEGEKRRITLTEDESAAIRVLARRLRDAGETTVDDEDVEERNSRITLASLGDGKYELAVYNAVGTIAFGTKQYQIIPKIKWDHFVYLAYLADYLPEATELPSNLESSRDFAELVSAWFVSALEKATRGELFRDYTPVVQDLGAVRGRVHIVPTLLQLHTGSMLMRCEYDEFSIDTAINRVCKAALRVIASSPTVSRGLRTRSMRLRHLFDGVGELKQQDLRVNVERRTSRFGSSLRLAKLVLRVRGIKLAYGDVSASCFLIPSPRIAEDAVRKSLRQGFRGLTSVQKGRLNLHPERYTVNPDIDMKAIDTVGDVKYKITNGVLSRGDMYQSIAFAAAYKRDKAVVVSFSEQRYAPQQIAFGDIVLSHLCWDTSLEPNIAQARMVQSAREALHNSEGLPNAV